MATKVDRWLANDGTEFKDAVSADKHDSYLERQKNIRKFVDQAGYVVKAQETRAENILNDYFDWCLNDEPVEEPK